MTEQELGKEEDRSKTEKLIEEMAKELCGFDNGKWDSLNEKTLTLFDGALSQATYLDRATELAQCFKDHGGVLRVESELPERVLDQISEVTETYALHPLYAGKLINKILIKAGFISAIEEMKIK